MKHLNSFVFGIIISIFFFIHQCIMLFKYKNITNVFMLSFAIGFICIFIEINIYIFYYDFFNGTSFITSYQNNIDENKDHNFGTDSFFWLFTFSVALLFICALYYSIINYKKN